MISIVTVNFNTRDWIELLIKSVDKFTIMAYELIVVDNASSDGSMELIGDQPGVRFVGMPKNVGHGLGLDIGIQLAKHKYVLVLDSDAHIQRPGWEDDFLALYNADAKTRLIAAAGGDPSAPNPKPIHACFQFFEREFFTANRMSFAPNKYDVGRKNYYDVIGLGYNVMRVPAGRKFYEGAYGDEYYIGGKPTIYHQWYSSRMVRIPEDGKVDNYKKSDFEQHKKHLFSQRLVKEILA